MYEQFLTQWQAARDGGTPLIAIQTPDPAATILRLAESPDPAVQWDAVRGLRPANEPGKAACRAMLGGADPSASLNPVQTLSDFAPALIEDGMLYVIHANRYLTDMTAAGAEYVQAIWNLRDAYKVSGRSLVLLAPSFTLPSELTDNVVLLDEPLPGEAELAGALVELCAANNVPLDDDAKARALDALRGLAAFPADQAAAMSVTGAKEAKRLDIDALWQRKRQMIAQTPGLSIYTGSETFADVAGCEQIKQVITRRFKGKQPPQAVLFMDEVEKGFAGATAGTSDTSGVAQRFLGVFLTWTQRMIDQGSSGILEVGVPGAAKSLVAKAAGNTFGVPTVILDVGGLMGSLVGESEAKARAAFKIIEAVAGRVLIIMTCNKQVALPPELKRRLTGGTFYFDLLTKVERDACWRQYLTKYGLPLDSARPEDEGWTGAEIKTACQNAWEMDIPLTEASNYIVPVHVSARDEIEALRRQAEGCFLSASTPGAYTKDAAADKAAAKLARKIAGKE